MPTPDPPERPPTPWQVVGSVLASFFGVQSSKNRRRDFTHGKAAHFIVAGVVLTAAFVGVVILVVRLVLRHSGL